MGIQICRQPVETGQEEGGKWKLFPRSIERYDYDYNDVMLQRQ